LTSLLFTRYLAGENVGKIYYRAGKKAPEQLLFDPAAYDKTKTYSVTGYVPSEDGRKLSIGLQEGGAELSTVRFLNINTKTFYPESLTAVFGGGGQWTPDSKGFLYLPANSTNPQDTLGTKNLICRYHAIGTNPSTDQKLFSKELNPDIPFKPEHKPIILHDDQYVNIYGQLASVDRRVHAFIAPAGELLKPKINWKPFATPADSVLKFVLAGNRMFLHSIKGAPLGQILVTDSRNPDVKKAAVFLPEGKLNITGIEHSKDFLFVTLSDGVNEKIRQYNVRTNQWQEVPLPINGTASLLPYDPRSNDCYLRISSWKQPATRYDYDPTTRKAVVSPFHVSARYPAMDDFVVEEIEVPSHDGVLVPLSLIYRKGTPRDGSAVCLLDGYGAYGSSATPFFSLMNHALALQNVIIAVAHVRGGSEKGQAWYRAGYKTTKPNTWKDFIACAEWLVKNKYTSPQHLAGMGTSAGGILIGRAITERPDLFAAAINNVGVTNMIRAENMPTGPANIPEFGAQKDSIECMALYEMDAMHHVRQGVTYPAVINVGGWNDPRVIAWEPGKFAAALQHASTSGKPVLMQVNYDNGHFTEDKAVTFRNFANMYAFALWQAGHPAFQPGTVVKKD